MSDDKLLQARRSALKCMAYGGADTLFILAGGVFTPVQRSLHQARSCGHTMSFGHIGVMASS
jgi:hypothetical protein